MIAGGFGREMTLAFGVGFGEVRFEVCECVFEVGAFAPIFDGVGEQARVLEVVEGSANCCSFRDRIDVGGKNTAKADLLPEIFQWLSTGPLAVEVFEVDAKIVGGDGSVVGVQMLEEVENSDVGKTEGFVTEFVDVGCGNGLDNLLFEVGGDGGKRVELLEVGGELPIDFGDLVLRWLGWMDGLCTRMSRRDKFDTTRCDNVGIGRDGDGEVAEDSVSAKRRDGDGVGVQLLVEEL